MAFSNWLRGEKPEEESVDEKTLNTAEKKVDENPSPSEAEAPEVQGSQKLTIREPVESTVKFDKESTQNFVVVDGYCVVQQKNAIKVIDSHGVEVLDFNTIGSRSITVNWTDLYTGDKSLINRMRLSEINVPRSLLETKNQIIDKNSSAMVKDAAYYKIAGKLSLTKAGNYLLLTNDGIVYLAFQVKKDGNFLPPRLWKRISGITKKDVPDEIRQSMELKEIENVEGVTVELPNLKEGIATVLDDKVRIDYVSPEGIDSSSYDPVQKVKDNICTDPTGTILSYCRSENPSEIVQINTNNDPDDWLPGTTLRFPAGLQITKILHLRMDPSGHFFTCEINGEFSILESDTLEPVDTSSVSGLSHQTLDAEGNLRGFNQDGNLVNYKTNLDTIGKANASRKAAKLAAGIDVGDIFKDAEKKVPGAPDATTNGEDLEAFLKLKQGHEAKFNERLPNTTTEADMQVLTTGRDTLKKALSVKGLTPAQVHYVTEGIDAAITEQSRVIAEKTVSEILADVRLQLGLGVNLRIIGQVSDKIARAKILENVISPTMRAEVTQLSTEFQKRSLDLLKAAGAEVQKEVDGIVEHALRELSEMDRHTQFDQWRDFELPRLKGMLREAAENCPDECTEALAHISQARIRLQALADAQEKKFRDQFEAVRERAATQTELITQTLKGEITSLIDRMRARKFQTREDAKKFIETAPAYGELVEEIRLLADRDRDASQELQRTLDVAVARIIDEVERKATTTEGPDGREMEWFGSKPFPKYEAPVAKKQPKQAALTFERLPHQLAVPADQLLGDVTMRITTSHGKEHMLRAWEGLKDESDLRYGTSMFHGTAQPSYMSQKDFLVVKKNFAEWKKEKGGLRQEYSRLRKELSDHYKKRKPVAERGAEDSIWQEEHRKLLETFSTFVAEKRIPLLQRLTEIENAPEPEYANGKGLVPEWRNHWVTAPEDEKMLEKMATYFEMQLKLQDGMLNLKGHAGTGKDVLMKMFASRTSRPYFGFDCTKWTTEADLSEDIVLESVNGAPQTVYVPSAVVTAIQTPGAILYFNEWNAMPESAQVFMHSLLDEKRAMTLKTRSGKLIKADPTVLIASSMNPNYAGTFAPQMATRSRIVDLEIDYPPLLREPAADDPNPNKPYSVSEALKIASSVPSLERASLDRNMEHNEFVKMWDHEINGIGPAPSLTTAQKFDIQAINALVQFSAELRDAFKAQYSGKAAQKSKALPVTAPITLREMRRCGYMLGEMTDKEKVTGDPEKLAKQLIEAFFLSHIDDVTDREKIVTAMGTMSAKKRLAA